VAGQQGPPAVPRRRRYGVLLLRALGLLLLVYVFSQVHWRDSVVTADGHEVAGRIVGEVPEKWLEGTVLVLETPEGERLEFVAADLRHARVGHADVPEVNEGLLRIVRRSDRRLVLAGFLLFGLTAQIGVARWWLLLRAQGVAVTFWTAHRLTFVGFFFNNVVPGPTGGDVVKAVYVASGTERRAQAVVTVLVDRVVGIVALALIAATVLLLNWGEPKYRELGLFIFAFLGLLALGAVLFFSRRVRRLLRLDGLSGRLPGGGLVRKVDEAMFHWRYHKGAVLVALVLSFANQLAIHGLMLLFAAGLHVTTQAGDPLRVADYMVVLPAAFIVSAVPVFPGGWGVREGAFAFFFAFVGVDRNPAVALAVLNGMTMLLWSLLGGVYFLRGRLVQQRTAAPAEAEADVEPGVEAAGSLS
jgi:glycosyltransferase 2 family protein